MVFFRIDLKNTHKKAFTLLEILLVISLITLVFLLSLFSFNKLRNEGKDKAIISNLSILRQAGEQYIAINSNYDGFCGDDDVMESFAEIAKRGKTVQCKVKDVTFDKWAACSSLYNTADQNWCVDSKGNSKVMPGVNCDDSFTLSECP